MEGPVAPTHVIEMSDQVHTVEFSPYEWSQELCCIGLATKIVVGSVQFQEAEDTLEEEMEFVMIREFHQDTRVHSVAWSPDTSLAVVPKSLKFASAGADHKVRLFSSDLARNETVQVFSGHVDYINSVRFEPENGDYLASVSDDHTCRLWCVKDGSCGTVFYLTSPGMSVCWHKEDGAKLMVGEKNGIIHMYNYLTHEAIQSFDTGNIPLMSADWAPTNLLRIAALAAGELIIWDVSRPSCPLETKTVHAEGGRHLRFSHISDAHIATTGKPGNQLKVTQVKSKHSATTAVLQVVSGLTWHYRLPYVCVGSDRRLCLWKVSTR